MTEHTPTPWRADSPREFAGVKWDNIIRSERRNDPVCSVFVAGYMKREAAANAAFIVKAVNSHDALVQALQFIADGYDNHDVNHLDYRVKVYQIALNALEAIKEPS